MARQMKDSGIEWIGEIPEDWQTVKAKYLVHINHGTDPVTEGDIPVYGSGSESFKTCGEYKEGPTVLIGRKGATLHIPHYIQGRYWNVDTAFDVKTKESYSLRLYYYAAICFDYRYYMSQTTLPGMTQTNYNNMWLPCPPLPEQQRIAAFLDRQCAEIDAVIERTKATIEEYKKLKQAVITETVTKGVRGARKMKDSGIEWIGEIPEEWKITALKRICTRISDGSHFSPVTTATGKPYVTAGDVHGKGIDYASCRTISNEDYDLMVKAGCKPHEGDVLIVKDGATTGRVGLMTDNTDCVLLSSVAMISPASSINSTYLMYLMESEVLKHQISKSMAGSAMPRITLAKLVAYTIIDCPQGEQIEIVKYLDKKCAALDTLIAKKTALLTELETYKKSLIYEYVTGKKEV